MSDAMEMEVEKKKAKKKDKKRDDAPPAASVDEATAAAAAPSTADDDGSAAAGSADSAQSTVGLSVIAHPLASRKLTKKLLKLVKKASKTKSLRRGVKEVVKAIRKGEKGLMVIAGNITPIDVITHLPVLCEESEIPYIYVPHKEELGSAGSTKRPTSCVLLSAAKGSEHEEYYEEVRREVLQVSPLVT